MKWASARYSYWLWRVRCGVAGWRLNGQYFLDSPWRVFSVSLFTCPQLPPFSLWWRGAALALALLYATTSMLAEQQYAFGWLASGNFSTAMPRLELANRLFPLEYRIRNAPAYLYVATEPTQVSRNLAIERVKTALSANPYAADLHVNLLRMYAEEGNQTGAISEYRILKRITPRSPLIQQLEKVGFQ